MDSTKDSPEELAGSLLMVGIEGPTLDPATCDYLNKIKPLGVILFARNCPSADSVKSLTQDLRSRFGSLLLAIDHEGGRVQRLPPPFTHLPPALDMAATADPARIMAAGRLHAAELKAAGFDINFAPVLDINTNAANPIIGNRAFGSTPEEVIHFALPYLQGLTEGGIIGCAKHFPGHGDTTVDSHLELPVLKAAEHSSARLREVEMRPFRRAISQGVPMIMTAHIVCEAFDANLPATMSPTLLREVLRSELGYRGMIVSDDLEMKAVADHWGVGAAAVAAINAGCDLCLVCQTSNAAKEAHKSLARAISDGIIDRFTLSDIARRRAKLLSRVAKMNRKELRADGDSECIGNSEHQRLSDSFTQS